MVSSYSELVIIPKSASEYFDIVSSGTVFVEFMSQWCSPCLTITTHYENLANQYSNSGTKFLMVDIDEFEEIRLRERITTVPVFVVYKDGRKMKVISSTKKDELDRMVQNWVN